MTSLERAKEYCTIHNRDLASLIDESLVYYLDTVCEAETEEMLSAADVN